MFGPETWSVTCDEMMESVDLRKEETKMYEYADHSSPRTHQLVFALYDGWNDVANNPKNVAKAKGIDTGISQFILLRGTTNLCNFSLKTIHESVKTVR